MMMKTKNKGVAKAKQQQKAQKTAEKTPELQAEEPKIEIEQPLAIEETPQEQVTITEKPLQEATKEPIPLSFFSPEMIKPAIKSLFDTVDLIVKKKLGEEGVWSLEEPELDNLCNSTSPVLNRYLSEWLKNKPELVILCITAGLIIAPRTLQTIAIYYDKKKPEEEAKK